ncbi:hypothetical protein EVAR_94076_1 [Eumeta japonica]|uniref:Uncharacterized protein n=1 Tax=Eumeta variegata TaxID=151549 RepID=A0A4C1V5F8_EUMVA|nr:hypothetical protein EVAR_94076_1 [Eumeta japonica]
MVVHDRDGGVSMRPRARSRRPHDAGVRGRAAGRRRVPVHRSDETCSGGTPLISSSRTFDAHFPSLSLFSSVPTARQGKRILNTDCSGYGSLLLVGKRFFEMSSNTTSRSRLSYRVILTLTNEMKTKAMSRSVPRTEIKRLWESVPRHRDDVKPDTRPRMGDVREPLEAVELVE